MKLFLMLILLLSCLNLEGFPQAKKASSRAVAASASAFTIEELKKLQALLETSLGNIVIEFFPDKAPVHVNYFAGLVKSGFYTGTTFHRVILRGIIQAGDPLSKDPAKKALYGSGGLKKLK